MASPMLFSPPRYLEVWLEESQGGMTLQLHQPGRQASQSGADTTEHQDGCGFSTTQGGSTDY